MKPTFSELISTEEQLRAVMGHPAQLIIDKAIPTLDEHCQAFIAKSPFVLIGSSDTSGNLDVSPKGDPPGFVQILDAQTLVIPDRLGNRRADTFKNVLQNPRVGLLFLIPGNQETLRVTGKAVIVQDLWVRERLAFKGKLPDLALVVDVDEAFLHCGKCVIRSKLWEQEGWPDLAGVPSLAQALVDQAKRAESVEEMQTMIEQSYRERLY